MHSVLITGGSGSFGQAFVKRLLTHTDPPDRIVVFSRSEHVQAAMAQELAPLDPPQHGNPKLRFFIGDVRDRDRLRRAMESIEVVVHAAALKRIEVCEYDPIEVIKTNVNGAVNVIEAAIDAGVKKVVALSTDKACEAVNAYGASKLLAEKLFLTANNFRGRNGPIYAVTRYGNVSGSNGSVIPTWRKALEVGSPVTLTDPDATRFWMLLSEAVELVLSTIRTMKGGELNIPTLPAYRLGDLAEAMGVNAIIVGMRPGEKLHESMSSGQTSDIARRMSVEELKEALRYV